MTLVISWVRTRTDGHQELVIASDSRLNGAGNLDCSPKLFSLPRGDSAIAFAGDTYYAYPLILQFIQAIQSYSPLLQRVDDFSILRTHALAIFNSMVDSFQPKSNMLEPPDNQFILAGYSWKKKSYEMASIKYRKGQKLFAYNPATRKIPNFDLIMFGGDKGTTAKERLSKLLTDKHGADCLHKGSKMLSYDMEPFQVLRDMLREGSDTHDTIGGAPQVVKITPYMECRRLAVCWETKTSKKIYLGGRPLLEYENSDSWILDPDTLHITHPRYPSKKTKS